MNVQDDRRAVRIYARHAHWGVVLAAVLSMVAWWVARDRHYCEGRGTVAVLISPRPPCASLWTTPYLVAALTVLALTVAIWLTVQVRKARDRKALAGQS